MLKLISNIKSKITWFLSLIKYRINKGYYLNYIKSHYPRLLERHFLLEKLGFIIHHRPFLVECRYKKYKFNYEPSYIPLMDLHSGILDNRLIWFKIEDNSFGATPFEEVFNSFSEKDKKIILFNIDLLQ